MYKLKTIAFCKINSDEEEFFPKISSNIIRRSAEYKVFRKYFNHNKLKTACKYGHSELIKYYINKVDQRAHFLGDRLDGWLIKYDHVELFKKYVDKSYIKDRDDMDYYIHSAHGYGSANMLNYLLEIGKISLNDVNRKLHYSAKSGHLDMVKYLVSIGADVRNTNSYAARLACQYGHLEVVKYLVSVGADISIFNNHALQLAIKNNHVHIAEYLRNLLNVL